MAWRSWHSRLRRLPAPVVDAGLAVLLAVAITVAINVAPDQGQAPDARAYGLGVVIAALSLILFGTLGRSLKSVFCIASPTQ